MCIILFYVFKHCFYYLLLLYLEFNTNNPQMKSQVVDIEELVAIGNKYLEYRCTILNHE
jgi:hypothetical protein